MHRRHFVLLPLLAAGCATRPAPGGRPLDANGFEALLLRLAEAWNQGDADAAARCFAVDAVYVEPPRKQLYRGRHELFRFFGGSSGRPGAMSMRWHRIVFDPERQAGMAEFTFRYGTQVHGVVVLDTHDGLISQWREYWYASELSFEDFTSPSSP